MTRFSLAFGVGRREPIARIVEIGKTAESLGFYGLWVQDNPLMTKDAYLALAILATNTSRIMLAPGVSSPALRHVSVLVNSIATLDQVSDGRAILGVGLGGPALLGPLGVPSRLRDFRESLASLRTLLRGDELVGPEQTHFRIGSVQRTVPMYVAARGPRMLQLAGEFADGVLLSGAAHRDSFTRKIEQIRAGARQGGRDAATVKLNFLINLSLDDNPERAIVPVRAYAASLALESSGQPDSEVPPRFDREVAEIRRLHDPSMHLSAQAPEVEAVSPELARYVTIAGDEAEVRARLESLLDLEPDEVTFTLMAGGRLERLQTLGKIVGWYGG